MQFDTTKYKVWTWKHPFMFHWIINPGLLVNELIIGQRVASVLLIERGNKPLAERTFVPCPHCETLHSGLKWTPQNNTAFRNWFGLYCDNCGKIIPCLRNVWSLIILILTFPVWYWFKDKWKQKWQEEQKRKFAKPLNLTMPQVTWWQNGLRFGVTMFIFMCFWNLAIDHWHFSWRKILFEAVFYIVVGGLMFGALMKGMLGKQANKAKGQHTS